MYIICIIFYILYILRALVIKRGNLAKHTGSHSSLLAATIMWSGVLFWSLSVTPSLPPRSAVHPLPSLALSPSATTEWTFYDRVTWCFEAALRTTHRPPKTTANRPINIPKCRRDAYMMCMWCVYIGIYMYDTGLYVYVVYLLLLLHLYRSHNVVTNTFL